MIIGIDAGGTSTIGALMDERGDIQATFKSGFGNPLIDLERALLHIEEVMKACREASNQKISRVIIGMAGYSTLKHKLKLPSHWENDHPVHILSDAELAFEAGIPDGEGILTIAGTGSIHIGKHNDKLYTAGGWGHLLGDEGGGYHIGKQAIRHVLTDLEYSRVQGSFTEKLLSHLNLQDSNGIKEWFYTSDKSEVAKLSRFVAYLNREKNKTASNLMIKSAESLAEQVNRLYKNIGLTDKSKLVVSGSLLIQNDSYLKYFKQALKPAFSSVEKLGAPPYSGAYSLHLKMNS
ncbi:N-acetylglucosamine kinase [Halobacillus campisalis]|uniref:N-acetylglucosamine kinase n=1 Tax=Halobacillus campisalis TaxID=435909 RepID=A0ABW2K4R7_9BACI|nr:BadF/BadG/BcrA/BcrD ATPase family protein [Halobacillus campisalis]